MEIISRAEAQARGLKRYFTGRPCKRGHIQERTIDRGVCVGCRKIAVKKWDTKNPEYKRASCRLWRERHYEKALLISRANCARWRAENLELARDLCRQYASTHRVEAIARVYQWQKDNPERYRALQVKRRVSKANPPWADQKALSLFYQKRPPGMEVDHKIPLNGFTEEGYPVCGLHIAENLQYLPPQENRVKGNRMPKLKSQKNDHHRY